MASAMAKQNILYKCKPSVTWSMIKQTVWRCKFCDDLLMYHYSVASLRQRSVFQRKRLVTVSTCSAPQFLALCAL